MTEQQSNFLIPLYEAYEKNPVIKGLIQALSFSGVPIGSMIDSSLGSYVNKIKAERLRTFFDELNRGDIVLTEKQIESNDFIHAYLETVSYVLRTKSDEKIKRFAKILKRVYSEEITYDDFEDYTAIFNDLSDREFAILSIKYKYEQKNISNPKQLSTMVLVDSYWGDFKLEISEKLNIKESEINSFLIRIQRTGCYLKPIKGIMFAGDDQDEQGITSEIFKKIMILIE